MKNKFILQLLIILSALLTSFSAPHYDLFPLAWFSFIPFFFAIEKSKSNFKAFLIGSEIGLIINLHAFYWINGTIVVFGNIPQPYASVLYGMLCAFQGLRYGIFGYFYKKFNLSEKHFLIVPLLYAFIEYFIPMLFNWTVGNTQYLFIPFIQIVDIFGISFLSLIMVMFSYIVFLILKQNNILNGLKEHKIKVISFVILFAVIMIYGVVQIARFDSIIEKSTKIKIGTVQANVDIFERRNHKKYAELTQRFITESIKLKNEGAELIIWPESSMVPPFNKSTPNLNGIVANNLGVPIIFGGISYKKEAKETKWFNSAIFIDETENVVDIYDKQYLLAFGEYIPFSQYFPSIKEQFREIGNLTFGEEIKAFNFKDIAKIGVMICYEDIIESFSNKIATKKPNIFINLTNDGWFLQSNEQDLHKMISIYRTLENRIFLIRATNTGRSVVIDAVGRLKKELPLYEQAGMNYDVPILNSVTIYQYIGYYVPYGYLLIIIGLVYREKRKKLLT